MNTTGRVRPRFSWLSDHWLSRLFISPTLAILLLLVIYVGLPFFVVSANAPMLQRRAFDWLNLATRASNV